MIITDSEPGHAVIYTSSKREFNDALKWIKENTGLDERYPHYGETYDRYIWMSISNDYIGWSDNEDKITKSFLRSDTISRPYLRVTWTDINKDKITFLS